MNSKSANQHDLVLLQAAVDARRAAREAQFAHEISVEVDGDLFPEERSGLYVPESLQDDHFDEPDCRCLVCEAVFSAETIVAAQALAAQLERDALARRVYDRIEELEGLITLVRNYSDDKSWKDVLPLVDEFNSLWDLAYPKWAD